VIKDIQYNSKSSNYKRYLKQQLQMSVGGGTSRADALLEERRRLLRTALKGEYIRKKYDPKAYTAEGGLIFDAAVQRWHALQFTYGDHFKPTFTNFMKFSMCSLVPVFLYYQFCFGPHHKEYNRSVRRGEVAYDAESRRIKYFN